MARSARPANSAYRRAFGLRVRELRLDNDMSQEALSLSTGIARSYMSAIERGAANTALDVIVRLADGLAVEPAELLPPLPRG